jgi:hypothetical protein
MLLIGPSTSHLLRVVTDAAGDIEPEVSVVAVDNTTNPPVVQGAGLVGEPLASITTATTTTLVTGAASTIKRVAGLTLRNNHASQTVVCTITREDGTDTATLYRATLLAGESLTFTGQLWIHYDVNGAPYPSVGNAATQAEMEAGTAVDKYVTPGLQHFHPSAVKCWGKANGAGTSLVVNYNVSSITDTGTGQLTVNVGTDFSSADYSVTTSVERVATSLAVANVDNGGLLRNASQAAGSFQIENYDDTATTHVAQDPAAYHWQCCGDQA